MIGDKDLAIAAKMLDLCATQQKLTAHNIANAEVDGFHRMSVKFTDELARAIESNDPDRISQVKLSIERAKDAGVDSDMEVAAMSRNEGMFTTFAEVASFRLRMLRMAVQSK